MRAGTTTLLLLVASAAAPALARAGADFTQHAAHEHGRATLDVAVDGGTVELRLQSPAIDVLGFERAPRTEAERKAVADAAATFVSHARLFAFPVAAKCTAGRATVEAPRWAAAGADDRGHDHDHDHDHADYAGTWTFTCAVPAALTFVDATFVARLRPGTVVQANVLTDARQDRQDLTATASRIRLK